MIKRIIATILIFLSNVIFAANIYEAKHQIDIWEENALQQSQTTADMLSIYSQSYEKWDKALNKSYKSLMEKISAKDKKLLRESQRKWLIFKDKEFEFMSAHIQRAGGSLSKIISAQRRVAFIRSRVIELEAYEFIFDSPP